MADKTKQKHSSAKLHKFIFQARYKPKLGFYNLLIPAALKIEGFPNWTTDRLSVVLKNFDAHASVGLKHDNFSYERDNDISTDEEEHVVQLINKLSEYLNVTEFIRIGYRKIFLTPVDMAFQELVDILHLKLFSQQKTLSDILSAKPSDLQYVVDATDKGVKYHFRFGPVVKKETPRFVNFNQENHLDPLSKAEVYNKIVDTYPDVALFSDIDMFVDKSDIALDEAVVFYRNAKEELDKLVKNLTNYLFI